MAPPAAGYLTLLALLHTSGQRTLAQMSSLDLVITVTLGSAFGRVITAREVALLEVVVAFTALVALQWIVANVWGRAPRLRRIVATSPTLLFRDGEVIEQAMRRHHMTVADLHTAARKQGVSSLEDVRAVLCGGNGSLSGVMAQQHERGRTPHPVP